jgi:thymidylate synthase
LTALRGYSCPNPGLAPRVRMERERAVRAREKGDVSPASRCRRAQIAQTEVRPCSIASLNNVALQLTENSLDDLLGELFAELVQSPNVILPTKGEATELRAVTLQLMNPLARLSRTQTRGKLFSGLGELCWYLSGSANVDAIAYYISRYREFAVGNEVPSAYGPRLRHYDGFDQLLNVVTSIKGNPWTRKAVIQIFDHSDLALALTEVPCTCTLQFLLRDGSLELIVYMRSNDAYLGLPHDIFAFTMIQELAARLLGVTVGVYTHIVGSMHLYAKDKDQARTFLSEGWQSNVLMPTMPGDASDGLAWLLGAESQIRVGADPLQVALDGPDPYWSDLACLLAIYGLRKRGRPDDITGLSTKLYSRVYDIYVAERLM